MKAIKNIMRSYLTTTHPRVIKERLIALAEANGLNLSEMARLCFMLASRVADDSGVLPRHVIQKARLELNARMEKPKRNKK